MNVGEAEHRLPPIHASRLEVMYDVGVSDRRSPEFIALVLLTALAVAPLWVGRFLPLYDYPAHLVVPAVLHHWGAPSTHVRELYVTAPGLNPNSLHYFFTWLLGAVLPLEVASKLFVSLALAALPWSVVYALKTFGRDWRLALLVLPLCYGRHFWYGFVGFCAAVPLGLVVLSLLWRALTQDFSRRRAVALAVATMVFPFVHFFAMAATVGVGALVTMLVARRRGARVVWRAAPLLSGPLVMVPWVVARLTDSGAAGATTAGPLFTRPPIGTYIGMLRHWFIDGYLSTVDEWLAALVVVSLSVFLLVPGLFVKRDAPTPEQGAPVLIASVFLIAYVVLPFELHRPFEWWAMNVRMIPFAFVWSVVAIQPGTLRLSGRWALAPVALASAAWFIGIAIDFRRFNDAERGLSQVLDAVPPGARVQTVLTDYRAPMHYSHYPFFYAGAYAVVQGGGQTAPFPPIPQAWVNAKTELATPFAGDSLFFDRGQHLRGSSHFLVRACSAPGCLPDPLVADSATRLVADAPPWRLYACVAAPCEAADGPDSMAPTMVSP